MKMKRLLLALTLMLSFVSAFAQEERVEMADAMHSNGKIYVVVGVVLIVLFGVFAYLIALDKKLKKLEKNQRI